MNHEIKNLNGNIYGGKDFYPVREISTIRDMFDSSCEIYSEKEVILYKKKHGEPYTEVKYKELKEDVYALGTAFIKHGLKGKRIAVMGPTRYEWALTYLATVCGTGTIVPIDKELPAEEVAYIKSVSEFDAIVHTDKETPKLEGITDGVLDIHMDENEGLTVAKLVAEGKELIASGDTSFINSVPVPEDVNIMLFTSGTTGLAKAVMLSQKNIATNLMQMCTLFDINEKTRFFSVLPIHHSYECTCGFLCVIYRGSSVAYCEGLKYIVKNLQEAKPTLFLAVPLIVESIYRQVMKNVEKQGKAKTVKIASKVSNGLLKVGIDVRRKLFAQIHEALGGRLETFIVGAAAADPEVAKGFRALGINVIQGYGMTECSPIVAVNRDFYFRDDSAGLPPPETQIKIDKPNAEGIGEILVKSESVMVGYYKNEEATANVIVDGWLHTGDLGYLKDGFIYITGRAKDVIITANGKNVFPEEVERYLSRSPYIAECMVYGKGEGTKLEVSAHIFPQFDEVEKALGKDYTQEAIRKLLGDEIKAVNEQMPAYKRVTDFDIRETEFVKTTTRKIKRHAN